LSSELLNTKKKNLDRLHIGDGGGTMIDALTGGEGVSFNAGGRGVFGSQFRKSEEKKIRGVPNLAKGQWGENTPG